MKGYKRVVGFEGKSMKTLFPKWQMIAILAIAVLAIGTLAGCSGEKINWADMELGDRLPDPPSTRGEVVTNSDEELYVTLEKVTDKQYNDYYDACVEKGFDIDGDKGSFSYDAWDSEGYKLSLSHYDDELTIQLESPPEFSTIEWPNSAAGNLLPVPKSLIGKFSFEYDDSFYLELGNTSKEDYKDYVKACSEKGFTVDYNKGDDYYYADNADGWHLSLKYEGYNIMAIRIDEPDEEPETTEPETTEPKNTEPENTEPKNTEPENTEPKNTEPENTEPSNSESEELVDGMRPEFKEAMDSYEEFFDEYIAFMKKYADSNGSDLSLLADYAKYLSKYAEMMEDFEAWDNEEMNAAETAYYIQVQSRISQKLLELAQ